MSLSQSSSTQAKTQTRTNSYWTATLSNLSQTCAPIQSHHPTRSRPQPPQSGACGVCRCIPPPKSAPHCECHKLLLVLIRYRAPALSHTPSGNTSKVTHTRGVKGGIKIRTNTWHANSVRFSMTTKKMFTLPRRQLLLIGHGPVSMAMKSASLCLGIMSCERVDVMYSTGMCTHMAVITQTHTHAEMQQEYHVSRKLGVWPMARL